MATTDLSMTFAELRSKLSPIVQQALQEAQTGEPGTDTNAAMDRIMQNIQGLIQHQADRPRGATAGIPLPQVDQELLPLQSEVEEVVGRLSQLRGEVPGLLSAAMQQQLEALRPSLEASDTLGHSDQGVSAGAEAVLEGSCGLLDSGADPEQLQALLADTLNKLPGLRARLAAVTSRLQRNVGAVEASQPAAPGGKEGAAAAAAPTTVDRVLRQKRRSSRGGATEEALDAAAAAGGAAAGTPSGKGAKGRGRRKSGAAAAQVAAVEEDATLQRLAEQLGGGVGAVEGL